MEQERRRDNSSSRERSGSSSTIDDYFKRKRGGEEEEEETQVFKRSSRLTRSPQKTPKKKDGLEVILKKLEVMERDIKELKEASILKEVKEELKGFKEEMRKVREELMEKERRWEEERTEYKKEVSLLKKKVQVIEDREIVKEREKRRNNIIITNGLKNADKDNGESIKHNVKKLCEEKLGVEVGVNEAKFIGKDKGGRNMVLAVLESGEDKVKVMKNKVKLAKERDSPIFISDDYCREDREVQAELRKIATKEREKGNKVKVGFLRLLINGEWKGIQQVKQREEK